MGEAPKRSHPSDAGFDLTAAEDGFIAPGESCIISTGLRVDIPEGFEIQIRSRSGNAAKHGVFVLNSPGTIDAGYTGVIKVILHNTFSSEYFEVRKGDRIAQAVVKRVLDVKWEKVESLSSSERGSNGLGSTGR
jgi:dUTP pyrophosphatase